MNNPLFPKLEVLMAERGETRTDLARLLGVTQGSASNRMTGRCEWGIRDIERVCAHYGKSFEEIFKR